MALLNFMKEGKKMARYNITPFNTGKFHGIKLAKERQPTVEQNKEKQRIKKLKKKRKRGN